MALSGGRDLTRGNAFWNLLTFLSLKYPVLSVPLFPCLCMYSTESRHLMWFQFSVVFQLPLPFCQLHTQTLWTGRTWSVSPSPRFAPGANFV